MMGRCRSCIARNLVTAILLRLIGLALLDIMPGKKKGLLSSLIEQGHLGASLVVDELELGAGIEEPDDLLVPVSLAGHASAGPIAIDAEGSVGVGSVLGPVGVAADEVHLVGEEGLAHVFSLVHGVLDEEGETEKRVVRGRLRRSFVVLVGGETELQGEDQEESKAENFHHVSNIIIRFKTLSINRRRCQLKRQRSSRQRSHDES